MKCRHCEAELTLPFVDLGSSPPSNAYLSADTVKTPEKWYPLRVLVCEQCWLVQTEDHAHATELFSADYAYFSSFSLTWLRHAQQFVSDMAKRFDLGGSSMVIEVAANDGYLLQYVSERKIPCLGIEPTASTAAAARAKGVEIIEDLFGVKLAEKLVAQGIRADLMVANNVLAHVPDINGFVSGISHLLSPNGVASFEFPHLVRLVAENQFDTIYHEHFSYLSLTAVQKIFARNGLTVFDVEKISTHGGSLRVLAQRSDTGLHLCSEKVSVILAEETKAGISTRAYYEGFQMRANRVKNDLLVFLLDAARSGKNVIAYGAAAKGNTLLNYAGVRPDLIAFVVDRNPAKQGKFMPGSRIPIVPEERLYADKPDYVLILPWNLEFEIMEQLSAVRVWGGRFVKAVPSLQMLGEGA